jgi:hypothetical protein
MNGWNLPKKDKKTLTSPDNETHVSGDTLYDIKLSISLRVTREVKT